MAKKIFAMAMKNAQNLTKIPYNWLVRGGEVPFAAQQNGFAVGTANLFYKVGTFF